MFWVGFIVGAMSICVLSATVVVALAWGAPDDMWQVEPGKPSRTAAEEAKIA